MKIRARLVWNDAGPVVAGRTYVLSAKGTWWDWFVPCGPEGYSTRLLDRVAHRRRSPGDAWFCLMGAVDRNEDALFRIGRYRIWTAPASGMLTCFANDMPKMYWNNWGAITLSVVPANDGAS